MNARVLIVEDEKDISDLIALYLENDGIASIQCSNAEDAVESFTQAGEIHLVVLDINLPGMDGFEFLGWLRKKHDTPVVIVSARDSDEDTVLGLGIGADDFITKPFSPKILVARIRANLRRYLDLGQSSKEMYRFGDFSLDAEGYYLEKNGERVPVPAKELALLTYLVSHSGQAIRPETLYQEIWGSKYGDLSTVAVHIQRLRSRLEEDPKNPVYLQTVRGRGYMHVAG